MLLLACVAVAPFPWGAILPAGNFVIEAFAFGTMALAFATRSQVETRSSHPLWIPAAGLAAIALLGLWQLTPLPLPLLRGISPGSAKVYADANAVLQLFGHSSVAPKISIAPSETTSTILLTLAYAALFLSGVLLCYSRPRRRWLTAVLFATSVIHAVVGTFQVGAIDRVHGAFINANHFAGYLQIPLAFAFGAILAEVLLGSDRVRRIRDHGERLENRVLSFSWRILLWGVIGAGIALTRSRGGVLAASLATIALIAIAVSRGRGGRAASLTIIAVALGTAFVAYTTGEAAILRFLAADPRDLTAEIRVGIWNTSIDAWRLFPHFGDGLGAFKEAFRRVQPKEIELLIEQAHNDFLQLLVTGGWVGALLGAAVFASLFLTLFRGWLRQHHREEAAFVLASFGALLALTLHGLVEFNMSVPAIPATLAVMLGAGASAGRYRAS